MKWGVAAERVTAHMCVNRRANTEHGPANGNVQQHGISTQHGNSQEPRPRTMPRTPKD